MSAKHTFLAFDCGATSGRGILATLDGNGFSMKEVYRFPSEMKREGGRMYWDVHAMYAHLVRCLSELGARGIRPDSIGIDTWGVDFGVIAKDGSLAGLPRCYRDPYTAGIPEKVFETIPREKLYARTGIQIMDFNTIFQLYARKGEGGSLPEDAGCLLFMPDLLSYMLTGNRVCEYTDASTSGMMDQKTRQFDRELLDELGIRSDILLPVIQPGTVVGTLKPELADATGLGAVPVIAVAGHDTASAIAAVPATDEKFAYLSSGTWSLMGIEVPSPVINARSSELNFTNEGGIEGTTRFLKNITGMWLLEECRRVWKARGRDYTYAQLTQMALSEEGFSGRIRPDDPRFASPDNMVAEIIGAAGSEMSDAQVVSCIYHSLADRYAEVMGMLREFAPFEIRKLHIIGGGSANDLLNQWTADATGVPVAAGPSEATAIGNVMMQARAAGLVKDRWQMRKFVAESFDIKEFMPHAKHIG
ncbi:MAG: rhamnulokinase [Bacteroidales bacterium]|nr:rhamnulokinase [Bacteroidales bacterium]